MTEIRKLFTIIFASKLNADKYGKINSFEELENLLENNPEDKVKIEETLDNYSDEELQTMADTQQTTINSNGGKLNYIKSLQSLKKGGKTPFVKKCKCGCDLIEVQGDGGKLLSKCACGCDLKRKKHNVEIDSKKLTDLSKFKKYKK